jgi:hypothetical protein
MFLLNITLPYCHPVRLSGCTGGQWEKGGTERVEDYTKNIKDLYRGVNEFKKGYQPRTNLVKDERGDLLADIHKSLNMWKNYFCQLLNVHEAGGVRQTEMHTAESFVPQPSASNVEVAIGKLKGINLQVSIISQPN